MTAQKLRKLISRLHTTEALGLMDILIRLRAAVIGQGGKQIPLYVVLMQQ
jgi:hypothetical protein